MGKKFVLSGYFGFKNFGDEAILSVLVNKLQKDAHDITIITSDSKYTREQFKKVNTVKTFDMFEIARAILKSDILISGGGSLLQDTTSFKSLVYYLSVIFIALFFGKKVFIFAQGIGPVKSPLGKFLTKNILKHCTYVSARDYKSRDLLEHWGINSDLVPDPVFSLDIKPTPKTGTVAVQLRNFKTMNDDFTDRLAHKISKEFSDKQIEIYSFQDSIDTTVCQKFQNSLNLLNPEIKTVLYTNLNNNDIIEKISKAEYLIAMRYHAIILGLLTKTKVLSINYDIKVDKISDEFGLPMINLKDNFTTQFEDLKKEDLEKIHNKVKEKNFDWSGFDRAVEESAIKQ